MGGRWIMGRGKRWLVAAVAVLAPVAQAHPGGLDANGCHNDRRNGGYHCHRGPSATPPRQATPVQSLREQPARETGEGRRPFRNCAEARAAGAAPVRRGEPGYGPHLDRDNDGIGCE